MSLIGNIARSVDQKIKTAAAKVPINLIPLRSLYGVARVFGYGAKKYFAGNYHTADDAEIANRYVGGFLRHLSAVQQPNGLYDWESLAKLDDESGLPEIDHAICGLIMLRALAIKHGALPADPGVGNEPTTVASRAAAEAAVVADELPTEKLVREARVAQGAFDVAPARPARPTGPGDTGQLDALRAMAAREQGPATCPRVECGHPLSEHGLAGCMHRRSGEHYCPCRNIVGAENAPSKRCSSECTGRCPGCS